MKAFNKLILLLPSVLPQLVRWLWRSVLCALLSCALGLGYRASAQTALHAGQNRIVLRGQSQKLYYLPSTLTAANMTPHIVLFAPGDGGWRGFAITIAQQLAAQGNDVYALDTKRYLSSFTHKETHLTPPEVMQDFQTLAAQLPHSKTEKVTLVGWSTGAGLTVLAAANADKTLYDGLIAISLGKRNILGWRCWDNWTYLTGKPPNEPTFTTETYLPLVTPLPVCIVQSSNDQFIPTPDAEELFVQSRKPKRFSLIHAGNHSFAGNHAEFFASLQEGLRWIERHERHAAKQS